MTVPSMRWRHVVINTHGSWLHGDQRGFRSRKHRIHSSGDYKRPPPKGEHLPLYAYQVGHSGNEIHIDTDLRSMIGQAIIDYIKSLDLRIVAVAVGKVHAHFVVELPDLMPQVRSIVGQAKRKSSRAVKKHLPGTVWGAGGTFKPIDNRSHLRAAHDYVIYDQGPDAWTWSYKDESRQGMFGRKRPRR